MDYHHHLRPHPPLRRRHNARVILRDIFGREQYSSYARHPVSLEAVDIHCESDSCRSSQQSSGVVSCKSLSASKKKRPLGEHTSPRAAPCCCTPETDTLPLSLAPSRPPSSFADLPHFLLRDLQHLKKKCHRRRWPRQRTDPGSSWTSALERSQQEDS